MSTRGVDLLVLLHGFEDDPARLATVAEDIDPTGGTISVLSPRGPHESPGGPSWLAGVDPEPDDVAAVLDQLDAVIDETCGRLGIERGSVVIGGFSQGGAAALALSLRAGDRPSVGGCFVLAGFLWPPSAVDYSFDRAAGVLPVLVVHGEDDASVPVQQGRSAARLLDRRGVAVTYREHAGAGHDLDPRYLADVKAWLAAVVRGEQPADPPS